MVAPNYYAALSLAKSFIHVYEKMAPDALAFLPLVLISPEEQNPSLSEEIQRLRLQINTSVHDLHALEEYVDGDVVHFRFNV